MEDAPCLERLLGNIRLNAAITIAGAPKLTALGYVVASIPMSFLGETAPPGVNKGIRAPIPSVKVLAISVKFSKKEDMEKAISVLEFFPFLETLHVQSSDPSYEVAADENDAIVSDYYQQCDPISCLTRHLRVVRLECEHHNRSMLEFACFLLARAHVLQFMKIQSRMSTNQQNLLKQSHMASLDAELVFENVKDRKSFTLEAVTALSDPFDGDTNILGY